MMTDWSEKSDEKRIAAAQTGQQPYQGVALEAMRLSPPQGGRRFRRLHQSHRALKEQNLLCGKGLESQPETDHKSEQHMRAVAEGRVARVLAATKQRML